jgi:hypothetical protein
MNTQHHLYLQTDTSAGEDCSAVPFRHFVVLMCKKFLILDKNVLGVELIEDPVRHCPAPANENCALSSSSFSAFVVITKF